MSDYSTLHPRATAESAFLRSRRNYMSTFLSCLDFWHDVAKHCGSTYKKQMLPDHFQILFLHSVLMLPGSI